MCRSIRPLFNFEPPAEDDEIRAASLQFVRKISGFSKPSKANEAAFEEAVDDVQRTASKLMRALVTAGAPRDRDDVAAKAKARSAARRTPAGT